MNTQGTIRRTAGALRLIAALAGVVIVAQAHAQPRFKNESIRSSHAHWTADGQLVDVQIQVGGDAAPLFFRPDRFDRHYFQAMKGQNYSLVLQNTTSRRIGVVISVDGLNVVNGERSSLGRTEPMYVLDPHERAVIRGWRTSLREVRRFVFVDEERSYAERTGQANGDMGWIRVASFREVGGYLWNGRRIWGDDLGESAPSAPEGKGEADRAPRAQADRRSMEQESRDEAPGTGWGERRNDPVRETNFRPERAATDQILMRYEYASGLRALGIFPRGARVWDRERGDLGFAQPPRW